MRSQLEQLGLSEPWSMLLVDQASEQVAEHHKCLMGAAEAARAVFRPESEKTSADYLRMVTELIEFHGGVDTREARSVAERCQQDIEAHFDRSTDEHELARLLCRQNGLARRREAATPPAPHPAIVDPVDDLLSQAISLGLWGSNREEVTASLVRRGLEGLVRDGLLALPSRRSPTI